MNTVTEALSVVHTDDGLSFSMITGRSAAFITNSTVYAGQPKVKR